jgi:glyoxylase-like metal-dependent hydrolase (beta-lactamase superfamily II)
VQELAGGLWRWTARHPEWHPGDFGAEVGCYALVAARRTVLIDPLAPAGDDEFWPRLDGIVSGSAVVVITIPYHVRSAEAVCARYPGTTVWGHRNAAKRLGDRSIFRELAPGAEPGGVRAFTIGRPRRSEMPVLVESHGALAFGDAVIGLPTGLRIWSTDPVDERRRRWYADRFVPTVEPLLSEEFDRVLVTHGPPVTSGGRKALAEALAEPPWYHRG